jgi:hypothetical protein
MVNLLIINCRLFCGFKTIFSSYLVFLAQHIVIRLGLAKLFCKENLGKF